MVVNCDIGERGVNHPTDLKLMTLISTANIACGGHAGDRESVDAFCALADKNNVTVSAHLSYPDKENFGRISMKIDPERLADSLSEQYELMPPAVKRIKFHGALYNDAVAEVQVVGTPSHNGVEQPVLKPGADVKLGSISAKQHELDAGLRIGVDQAQLDAFEVFLVIVK